MWFAGMEALIGEPRKDRVTLEEAAEDLINDYRASGQKSIAVLERRIRKHLRPFFGGKRLATLTGGDIAKYIAKRLADVGVVTKARTIKVDGKTVEIPATQRPVSHAEINRELTALKRMYNLAMENGKLAYRPTIKLLIEDNVRTGFFEADQFAAMLAHLPAPLQPPIRFAYLTGWRILSEVVPLEWRQVDFAGGEIRLDPGATKNRDGRVFPMTTELRTLLRDQWAEHERLRREGRIVPWVFHRDGAPIISLLKASKAASKAAGCPGRIPHDLRRTAVRNLVCTGIPERVAMKMTGRKTRSVFERYNIVSDSDLGTAAKLIDHVAGHTFGHSDAKIGAKAAQGMICDRQIS